MGAENYIQIMRDSLQKKENLLKQIIHYNEDQQIIITSEPFDGEAFQENLDRKGELIEAILKLDEGFNSVYLRIREQLQNDRSFYADDIRELQAIIKSVTALGVRVQAQELRNKELAEKKFAGMKKELSNAKKTTSKVTDYYKNVNRISSYDAHFLDQKK